MRPSALLQPTLLCMDISTGPGTRVGCRPALAGADVDACADMAGRKVRGVETGLGRRVVSHRRLSSDGGRWESMWSAAGRRDSANGGEQVGHGEHDEHNDNNVELDVRCFPLDVIRARISISGSLHVIIYVTVDNVSGK